MDASNRRWFKQLIEANNRVVIKALKRMHATMRREIRAMTSDIRRSLRDVCNGTDVKGKRRRDLLTSGAFSVRDTTSRNARKAMRDARLRKLRIRISKLEQ